MSEFKQMVKMLTNEPSVILKLKKGGKVSEEMREKDGHKAMNARDDEKAEEGKSPKKPSMAERRKAMNPNFMKKGGRMAHKDMGGAMPMPAPDPMSAPMPAPMPMQKRRKPMPMPMPTPSMDDSMPTPMSRPKVMAMNPKQSMARRAMLQKAITGMKKGGGMESHIMKLEKELRHHESMPISKAHHKADGGAITASMAKTTIKGNAGKFLNTDMETAEHGSKARKGSGDVKMGNGGGYADGGTIKGNAGKYLNTDMNTAENGSKAKKGSGDVKMGNGGGYAKGGNVNWENRPADTAKAGKTNTTSGGVKYGNGGGYKDGGKASKKAYATGGIVNDEGKAVKMPRHFVSQPVANTKQSGTFKTGGKVQHHANGGSQMKDDYDPEDFHGEREDSEGRIQTYRKNTSPRYSETAVNKSIASSNRSGRKISGKEAKAIHSLLKGRH
jgi:hypothetical protein